MKTPKRKRIRSIMTYWNGFNNVAPIISKEDDGCLEKTTKCNKEEFADKDTLAGHQHDKKLI